MIKTTPKNKGMLGGQSAVEYLTTYGIAILIIAIIGVTIYGLNLLNPYSLSPKANPSSCQVTRPNGPGSDIFLELVGPNCMQNDIPEYVAQFNGQSSYINLGNPNYFSPEAGSNGGRMSICAWYYIVSLSNYHGFLLKGESSPSNGNGWEYAIGQGSQQTYVVWTTSGADIASYSFSPLMTKRWTFTCFTYNYSSSTAYVYINTTRYAATFSPGTPASQTNANLTIGAGENGYSNVELSNLQIYNTTLSQQQVQTIYSEGIGGAPIDLTSLVGWWPLNGNAKDYSGNQNEGISNGVTFISNWESGYSTPK